MHGGPGEPPVLSSCPLTRRVGRLGGPRESATLLVTLVSELTDQSAQSLVIRYEKRLRPVSLD